MNAFIRLLYALLVAAVTATFLCLAVYTFYQPPKTPHYPNIDYSASDKDYQRQQDAYDQAINNHDKDIKSYQRNFALILLPFSLACVTAGLYLLIRMEVVGEGLALGGIFTQIVALIMASLADSRAWRFVAVLLLLLSVVLVAQVRFASKNHRPLT